MSNERGVLLTRNYYQWEGATPENRLIWALADLRDYADANGLDFGRCDKEAHEVYRDCLPIARK